MASILILSLMCFTRYGHHDINCILLCVERKTGLSNMYGKDGPFYGIISPTTNNIHTYMRGELVHFSDGMEAGRDLR